jgi:hypothetical protein
MHSKVSSDWLPRYIKAMRPVLEMFKMVRYFPDSPRISNAFFMGLLKTNREKASAGFSTDDGRS